jgi:hypothetical protein
MLVTQNTFFAQVISLRNVRKYLYRIRLKWEIALGSYRLEMMGKNKIRPLKMLV